MTWASKPRALRFPPTTQPGARRSSRPAACRAAAVLLIVGSTLGVVPPLHAQGASRATLGGTVVDTSGGVLPGAAVTLVNVRTKAQRTATTGAGGTYVFVGLVPGDYRVNVGLPGFRPWESSEVHLSPGDSLEVEARLEVGAQTERVEVTAERRMVRTDQGAREGLITSQQIQNLSIISRGAMELLKVLPGTVTPDQSTMETVGFTFSSANDLNRYSVNGSRGTAISPVIDGSKIVDFGSNGTVRRALLFRGLRVPAPDRRSGHDAQRRPHARPALGGLQRAASSPRA